MQNECDMLLSDKEEEHIFMQETNVKRTSKFRVIDMAYIALFAALIVICSWISIPMTIPFTLQTFAVFAAVGVLGGRRGTIAVVLYLLLGIVGLPVFTNFNSGLGALLGVTGGYAVGFVFSALIVWFATAKFGNSYLVLAISMALGMLACYACGTAWFMVVYSQNTGTIGFSAVLSLCVFPFVIPDAVKITLAILLSKRVGKYIK